MKRFRKMVKLDQQTLKAKMTKVLKHYYRQVVSGDGFVYAKGNGKCPILLTAHMDTVHNETVKEIEEFKNEDKTVLSSPQGIGGDDRCGIWMIYKIVTTTKYRPSILLCEDEEIGGVGSEKFVGTDYVEDLKSLKYLVELDRANDNDAVYYDCGNEDFMVYIEKTIGYKEAYGSFSDIGHLSPACDKASVNLSCGYYKQHTLQEYVVLEEMQATLEKVKILLADSSECKAFDYQEVKYDRWAYSKGYSWWDNSRFDYSKLGYANDSSAKKVSWYDTEDDLWRFEFNYYSNNGEEEYKCEAYSLEEAVGSFLMAHPNVTWNSVYDYSQY